MPTGDITREQAVLMLPLQQWAAQEASSAVSELEQGKVLFLPELAFHLSEQEMPLLDPALVDPKRKNISYQPLSGKLTGVAVAERQQQVQQLLERYYQSCRQLIAGLLPEYQEALHHPTGSLRLHPVSAWRAASSGAKTTAGCTSTLSHRARTTANAFCVFSPISIRTVKIANGASVNLSLSWRNALCRVWLAIRR